jgi:serine/threonine protein kinase
MPRAVRYRVLRKIAHGGMAEIFLALQTGAEGFQKPVVLKRILPAFAADPHFVRMLVDEAHIASSLSHSHLVQILDLGKSGGQFFLVLEFVDGWSLEQVRRRAQKARLKFPLPLALYIVSSLCRALSYVHRRGRDGKPLGIVHRDISPQNVLLGREGEVKLADFGIAKAVGRREKSATGIIKGKFAYMSPEQSIGSALDARSDLFSVGTLLYILTTGKKPFEAPTDLEVLMQVRRARFEKPSAFLKEFNLEVERFIGRALRADRSRRWQSAEQMADRLDGIQVKLGQPTGPAALKRWLEALSERDGIQPPGDLPEVETDINVGTIELETGDLELHDTGSGEIAMPVRTRAAKTRQASVSPSVLAAAVSPSSASGAITAKASISGASYASLSIVAAEADGDEERADEEDAHKRDAADVAQDAEAAAAAAAPEPAAVIEPAPARVVPAAAPPVVAAATVVEPSPVTILQPTTIPAAGWPQPDPTVRRPALFVLGQPAAPTPPIATSPAPLSPEAADTIASHTPPWEPIARPSGGAAAAPTNRYPIVFPPVRRARPPTGAPKPLSDAAVAAPARGSVLTTDGPRLVLPTDPLARTVPLTPMSTPSSTPSSTRMSTRMSTPMSARPAAVVSPPPVAFVRPPPVAAPQSTVAADVADPAAAAVTPPPLAAPAAPAARVDDRDSDDDSESLSVDVAPPRKRRRWARRLLVAATSVAILSGGGYFTRPYWEPRVLPHVAPSLPPWVIARLTRPIDTWLQSVSARLHLGPAEQADQRR